MLIGWRECRCTRCRRRRDHYSNCALKNHRLGHRPGTRSKPGCGQCLAVGDGGWAAVGRRLGGGRVAVAIFGRRIYDGCDKVIMIKTKQYSYCDRHASMRATQAHLVAAVAVGVARDVAVAL